MQFKDDFTKKQTRTLPEHCSTSVPSCFFLAMLGTRVGTIYCLPETEVMSAYIKENLERVFIQDSSNSGADLFYFLDVKSLAMITMA